MDKSKIPAGIAGVTGGTLWFYFIAYTLEDSNPIKQWLLFSAPSITIFFSAVWLWLQVFIKKFIHDKQEKNNISEVTNTFITGQKNEFTSKEHKAKMAGMFENFELNKFENFILMTNKHRKIETGKHDTFNQQGQTVQNQYIAETINFGQATTPDTYLKLLRALQAELDKVIQSNELENDKAIDVEYHLKKAVDYAEKPDPDKKSIIEHLTSAKDFVSNVGGLALALNGAIAAVGALF